MKVMLLAVMLLMFTASARADEPRQYFVCLSDADCELRIRGRPSLGADQIAWLCHGDMIMVTSIYKGWARVEINDGDVIGWVSRGYLADEPLEEHVQMIVESNGRVRIREWPGGDRSGWVQNGQIVTVRGYVTVSGKRWALIDGGVVDARYLREGDEE